MTGSRKKASFFGRQTEQELKGSITVEASLCFPVFFFALIAICSIFFCMRDEYEVEKELLEQARKTSLCSEDLSRQLMSISSLMGDRNIETESDGEDLTLTCSYRHELPAAFFEGLGLPVSQQLKYRYFSGHSVSSKLSSGDEEDDGSDMVYVTPSGSVYHVSLDCPSLRISLRAVDQADIDGLRNQGGCKYYPCERCALGKNPDLVYITDDGRRYHCSSGCTSLKRDISQISLTEAEEAGRRCCKRCLDLQEG